MNDLFDDLPEEDKESSDPNERLGSGNSPMTTLTLSAGLTDAEREKNYPALLPALSIEQIKTAPVDHSSTDQPSVGGPTVVKATVDKPTVDERTVDERTVDELDDHSLIEATRTGDEAAFKELMRRYSNQITNFVYRMLEDYDRAVDLAQETFVRVYLNIDRYQATYSFSTYIYKIAHNLAISELRKRKRHRLIQLPTFFSDKDSEEVEVELPDQSLMLADDAMIDEERRNAVAKAIATLPEKYRAALVLCDLEERSYEEISEILGLPTGTVKSRINRARNLLKEKLRDYL